jgi:hypothetical protein
MSGEHESNYQPTYKDAFNEAKDVLLQNLCREFPTLQTCIQTSTIQCAFHDRLRLILGIHDGNNQSIFESKNLVTSKWHLKAEVITEVSKDYRRSPYGVTIYERLTKEVIIEKVLLSMISSKEFDFKHRQSIVSFLAKHATATLKETAELLDLHHLYVIIDRVMDDFRETILHKIPQDDQ